ncbi:HlyD family efflux transporter periplasmic adaptor subunit, partial [Escherichia coli]|uniref:HlyD family efflux transporter periplasmic adaptor subunit n=1 Tax=Escherichia coli TaxID=562 RepID=UPI00224635DE
MSSNFERSQLTKIMISSAPVTAETLDSASYLGLSCTIKEVQFTAGQKQDIDVTTVGGVIAPGGKLMTIVPLDEQLLIEAKISPRDVAFIHPGQKSLVKITAYDYSIYG